MAWSSQYSQGEINSLENLYFEITMQPCRMNQDQVSN